MNPLQNFWRLTAMITSLYLTILLGGCGSPPLIQPQSDAPAAQTTAATSQPLSTATAESETAASPESVIESTAPESPLATPPSSPATETSVSSSNEIEYAAEKISLAPVNLSMDLPEISAQDAEPPPINFGGWSNSGQQFAFAIPAPENLIDPDAPEGNNTFNTAALWIVNLDGSGLQKITDQIGSLLLWSPDDTRIAYYRQIGVSRQELWVVNLTTKTHLQLDEPAGVTIDATDYYTSIAWLDNDRLLYGTYSKGEPGRPALNRRLWLHNIQTKQIEEVQVDDRVRSSWLDIWLAPNKTAVLIWTVNDAWILGQVVEENQQDKLNVIKTVITEDGLFPFWSPDSTKLAMTSYNQLAATLRIIDLDSDQITELPFPGAVARVEWSPDSQAMIVRIFGAGTETPSPIYTVNANGSGLRQLGAFFLGTMQWSPDGQYLGLFLSDDTDKHNPFGIIKVEVNQ